jgi:hypothetical protein
MEMPRLWLRLPLKHPHRFPGSSVRLNRADSTITRGATKGPTRALTKVEARGIPKAAITRVAIIKAAIIRAVVIRVPIRGRTPATRAPQ